MQTKKPPMSTRAALAKAPAPEADNWVKNSPPAERKARLTIEISASLHGRIKSSCALRNVKMVEELTYLLEKTYP